jgi:hypothetical protein
VVKKRIDPAAQVYRLDYRVPYDELKKGRQDQEYLGRDTGDAS